MRFPPPPIFCVCVCVFFCPIRMNVGTGSVYKSVLNSYEVHENWSMKNRTFPMAKVVPVYVMKACRGVEA